MKQSPLFAFYQNSELTNLIQASELESYETGQVIFSQGDAGDRFYVVYSGRVKILMRKEAEERKLWVLFTDAICWHSSQQIRAYIQAVKDNMEKSVGDVVSGSSIDQWITWAQKQADRLDPLAESSYCTKDDRKTDPSSYQKEPNPETEFDLTWQRLVARSDYFERSTPLWTQQPHW